MVRCGVIRCDVVRCDVVCEVVWRGTKLSCVTIKKDTHQCVRYNEGMSCRDMQ